MTQLGKYTLEKRIGSGGMADVWLAKGPSGVCVLKCPHRHLCNNPEFVKMFLDEASLLAQLHHPNIARVYDLGNVNGAYYLAMEYVPGFDLMSISLEHERHGELMSVELCARIVADAASALHYAHEAKDTKGHALNIVHRDVTPHNILLSRQGVVKLIDFGVAKASSTMHRTQAGFVKGKYPYMSPEQITNQIIDRRVDVYALGLVLYELLTNVRAISGNTELEQIDAARSGRIRPIEQLRPNVPVPIRQILAACIHFDVSARYPTALALKEDLEKFLTLERQVVGQEDLLRLFRVVAADTGDTSMSDRRTELEQPVSDSGAVVLPDSKDSAAQIDALGYSPTAPSMKMPVLALDTPASQGNAVATPQQPVPPQPEPARPPVSSQRRRVAPMSRAPLYVLTGISLSIIVMVLALWKPWASEQVDPSPVVDAGTGIAGKIDKFDFPPEAVVDAGVAAEPPVVDAGLAVAGVQTVDAGSAVARPPLNPEVGDLAWLTVEAAVPASITIDGNEVGTTPLKLELSASAHTLVAKGEGLDKKQQFKLKRGEKKTISLALTKVTTPPNTPDAPPSKADPGTLEIHANPFCSAIKVDGAQKGLGSLITVTVPPGAHSLECVLEDASLPEPKIKRLKVTVGSGKTEKATFNMLE